MSEEPTRPDSDDMDPSDLTEDLGPLTDHDLPTRRVMQVDDPDFLALTRRAEAIEPPAGDLPVDNPTVPHEAPPAVPDSLPEHPDSWRQMVEHIPPRTYHNVPSSPPPPPVPPPTAPSSPTRVMGGPGGSPRKRRRTARDRRESGWYLPWWSLLVMLGVVVFFATLLLLGLNLLGGGAASGGETPQVIVVTGETDLPSQPATSTPLQIAQPGTDTSLLASPTIPGDVVVPTLAPSPASTEAVAPPAEGPTATTFVDLGGLRVGAMVRVTADALNIRAGAGTAFDRVALAQIDSLWEITDGPQEAEGYTWWQVQNPDDPTQEGWAVEEFLELVEG